MNTQEKINGLLKIYRKRLGKWNQRLDDMIYTESDTVIEQVKGKIETCKEVIEVLKALQE